MRPIVVVLALILNLPGQAVRAESAKPGEPGVVFISAGSRVAERDRTLAMEAAETRLRAAGWDLATKPFSPKEVDAVSACLRNDVEAWPCVSKVIGTRGIRRVASVALKRDTTVSGTRELVLTGRLVVADLSVVVVSRRFCEQCTDDTLSALTTELTTDLLQQAALESGRTVLSIKSTPQGAIYTVDGVLKSATDALITIVPGRHVITIEREGYQTETRTIEAVEGKTSDVMVTLRHLDQTAGPPQSPDVKPDVKHRSRALPIALVSAGGAAVVGGAVLLAFNQGEIAKPRGEDQPRLHFNALPVGLTSIAVGVATAGLGGYLWWRFARNDASSGRAPVASLVDGGAVIGVSGTF